MCAVVIGDLQVNVKSGTAELRMDQTRKQLGDLASSAQDAGQKLDYSMRESRESIMLTGEALGVHLPAGITRVIASIGPLGSALASAMPAAALVAGVALFVEALDKAKEKVSTFGVAWAETAASSADKTGSLYEEILKLRDETAKLYGHVPMNGVAIAAFEALTKVEGLDSGILKTMGDMEKLMKEQSVGTFASLLTGASETSDIESALKPKMDAAKNLFAEVMNAESQLGLDMVNKASKATLDSDKALITSKKTYASAALAAVQFVVTAQTKALDDQIEGLNEQAIAEGQAALTGEEIQRQKDVQQGAQRELLQGVRLQTQSLQTQLGLETALTTAMKQHAAAEEHKSSGDAIKKKLKDWEDNFRAAMKYRNAVAAANLEEQKREGKGDTKGLEETKQQADYMEKLAEAERNVAKAQTDLNAAKATDAIEQQIAAYKRLASEGFISQQQLAGKLIPLYQEMAHDQMMAVVAEIEQQGAIISAAQASGDAVKADKASEDETKLLAKLQQIRQKYNAQQADLNAQQTANWMHMVTQMETGFNQSIAKTIVEGKNFGQSMRQVAAQFSESMIGAGLKWLENWIIQHTVAAAFGNSTMVATAAAQKTAAASLAGANAVASFSLAPWPIDMGAPAFGASMAAAALGFNEGGIVPGSGYEDTVPAILTPGEAVLPQPMVERLSSASASGGDTYHMHYSQTNHLKAWDGSDVKDMLDQHKGEFVKHAVREIRRRHK